MIRECGERSRCTTSFYQPVDTDAIQGEAGFENRSFAPAVRMEEMPVAIVEQAIDYY